MKKYFFLIITLLSAVALIACNQPNSSFVISFDSNGGSPVESITYNDDATITIPNNPTKEGLIFDGWYWDNGTFENPFTANSLLDTPIEDDLTVYAKWVEQDDELTMQLKNIYLLAVQVNAFEGTYEEWLETVRGPQGVPGEDGKSSLIRVNDSVIEWQPEGDSSWTVLYDLNDLVGADGVNGKNVVLQIADGHIQWQYDGDTLWNNLIALQTITGADGRDGADGREILFQVADGYIQWQYKGDLTWINLIEVVSLVGTKGNDGLSAYQIYLIHYPSYNKTEAEWLDDLINNKLGNIEEYTVQFNANGGYIEGSSSIKVSNMGYLILPVPQREGYKFTGWYTGEGPNDLKFTNFSPVVTNMDLYAKWEVETYLITFELNGGEFTDAFNETVFIDSNTTLIGKNTDGIQEILFYYNVNSDLYQLILFDYMGYTVEFVPIREGYTFVGWYEDEHHDGEQAYTFGGGEIGNRILYAKWQENPSPYIAFIPTGGNIVNIELGEFDPSSIINKFVITNDQNQEIFYIYESYIINKFGLIYTYVLIDPMGVIIHLDFFEINQTYNIDVTKANFYAYIGASIYNLVPVGDIISGATGSYNSLMMILNDIATTQS